MNGENQAMQARYAEKLWHEIDHASEVCVGSSIMAFQDQWWKGGDWNVQKPGGPQADWDLDGVMDEAYWGLYAVEKDPHGGIDHLRPRKVVDVLRNLWQP